MPRHMERRVWRALTRWILRRPVWSIFCLHIAPGRHIKAPWHRILSSNLFLRAILALRLLACAAHYDCINSFAALVSTLRRRHQDKTRERSHAGPVFLALRLRLLHAIRRTPGTPTKRYADMGIQPHLAHLRYFPIRLTTHNPKVCHTTVIVPMTTPSYAPSPPRARSPSYASHQTRIISMIIFTAPPPQLPLQSTSISQCRSNLSMIQDLRASLLTV
jgi:hypothetical protein